MSMYKELLDKHANLIGALEDSRQGDKADAHDAFRGYDVRLGEIRDVVRDLLARGVRVDEQEVERMRIRLKEHADWANWLREASSLLDRLVTEVGSKRANVMGVVANMKRLAGILEVDAELATASESEDTNALE